MHCPYCNSYGAYIGRSWTYHWFLCQRRDCRHEWSVTDIEFQDWLDEGDDVHGQGD